MRTKRKAPEIVLRDGRPAAVILDIEHYAFENLWRQYRACRRNKRNTINQLRFEIDAEANLLPEMRVGTTMSPRRASNRTLIERRQFDQAVRPCTRSPSAAGGARSLCDTPRRGPGCARRRTRE